MTQVLHGEHKLRWAFLAVNVTPNPCPRHVCLMSVTMLMTSMDRMLLTGKHFANEGF